MTRRAKKRKHSLRDRKAAALGVAKLADWKDPLMCWCNEGQHWYVEDSSNAWWAAEEVTDVPCPQHSRGNLWINGQPRDIIYV